MKWIFAFIVAGLFGVLFFGTTNWTWWTCACAGILSMWFCTLVFMAVTNAILNSKKNLLKEIEYHEDLENRLVDDVLSLIELYNLLMPNSAVMPPDGTTEKLHKAMMDIDDFMKSNKRKTSINAS